MNSEPVIRVAAAVIRDARGRMLVVRKRRTAAFMQPGGKIMPGWIRRIRAISNSRRLRGC
ncbi:MAG TPA: hypothetical protein VHT50_02015 [Mycobacterium sp.]|nr:hypothetical protein [Mycobacterium sp.]